mmetsp:Transcript_126093/g.364897  ORF Transcript_126093/g.364897 Transcript_126093/m.364897 type:complete len:221 (-) Transcript_126093:196-858(-)
MLGDLPDRLGIYSFIRLADTDSFCIHTKIKVLLQDFDSSWIRISVRDASDKYRMSCRGPEAGNGLQALDNVGRQIVGNCIVSGSCPYVKCRLGKLFRVLLRISIIILQNFLNGVSSQQSQKGRLSSLFPKNRTVAGFVGLEKVAHDLFYAFCLLDAIVIEEFCQRIIGGSNTTIGLPHGIVQIEGNDSNFAFEFHHRQIQFNIRFSTSLIHALPARQIFF